MLKVHESRDFKEIVPIVFNPKILEVTALDDEPWATPENFHIDPNRLYLISKEEDSLVGLAIFERLSKKVAVTHTSILPHWWGKPQSVESWKAWQQWLKENTEFEHVVAWIPKGATHVINMAYRCGAVLAGDLPDAVTYQGKLTDMFLMRYRIKR